MNTEKSTPIGINVVATLFFVSALYSIFYVLQGHLFYIISFVVYSMIGYGIQKLKPIARIGALIISLVFSFFFLYSLLWILIAIISPEFLNTLQEMGLDTENLAHEAVNVGIQLSVNIFVCFYLFRGKVKAYFNGNEEQKGAANSDSAVAPPQ